MRPLRRSVEDRLLGGVCGGLARRLGVSSRSVRVVFVLGCLLGGAGAVVYVAAWVLVPRADESDSIASRIVGDRRELQIVLAVSTVVLAMLIVLEAIGLPGAGTAAWPLGVCALGGLAVWRGASATERAELQELLGSLPVSDLGTSKSWRAVALRAGAGIVLVLAGIAVLARAGEHRYGAAAALLGAVALVAGFLVLFAPWWLHTLRELTSERRERVRAEERGVVAAHLHDSVLQTLTLIQRNAERPEEVVRLARLQERELRGWLFDPSSFGRRGDAATTIADAARDIEREVEDNYGVALDLVVVGDGPIDDDLAALLAAGREAALNAATWSGASSISVYIEAEPDVVTMFVRDLGVGFDPSGVPADRRGIAHSIVERLEVRGGTAAVRSAPGHGTEVELAMPRASRAP